MPPRHYTEIEWSDSLLPPPPPDRIPAALAARARTAFGGIPPWLPPLQWSPWLVEAMIDAVALRPVHIDFDTVMLVRLVVAQDNSCRYCYGTARVMLRILGFSEPFVQDLERDLLAPDLDRRRRAALEHARQVSRAARGPAVAGLDATAAAEVAVVAATWIFATRITTLLAVPPSPDEELMDRWWVRVTRPLLARSLRRLFAAYTAPAPDPDRRITAFDPLVTALGDLPVAANLRKILDGGFADAALPRRARLIVAAVIVRALGSEATLALLRPLLAADGLEPAALDAMLDRLDADWLDDRERLLLHAARDTVHIHAPLTVQRRMLEVRDRLTTAEFVDFTGVAAVANALARLGAALPRC